MSRKPFDFHFESPRQYRRHQQFTMSSSDPNPDVQQDDNYATQRLKERWGDYIIGVRGLKLRANGVISWSFLGVIGAILRHLSLQFWNGLDHAAFVAVVATILTVAFSFRRSDDARYGGMHSLLWIISGVFVIGRTIAVYLNLYPSALPNLGVSFLVALGTGTRLDDWMSFVGKAPLEWMMVIALACAWTNRTRNKMPRPTVPPGIFFDRFTPPDPESGRRLPIGVFSWGLLVPILAPAPTVRVDIFFVTLYAAAICLVLLYVLVVELTDFGKAAVQDPDITYGWFNPFGPRRFQIFDFLGLCTIRVFPIALAGMFAALLLGNIWCAGAAVIAAYALVASLMAPAGAGNLFDRLVFIFQHYPGEDDDRPAPGRFAMSEIVANTSDRDALLAMAVFSAATAVYSLQTLIPTWPNVARYWFFITDLPPMEYTAIGLSILFQGVGSAIFVKAIFVAGFGQLMFDRFEEEMRR